MDGHQFDDLLRTLARSRRAAIVTLVGAAAGVVGLPDTAAGKKRKKKKKKCRGCPACTSCVKGKCVAVPNFTPCGGACQECQGGQCVNKANGTTCGGTNQCLNGVCNPQPNCISFNVGGCDGALQECCSGVCDGNVCTKGIAGRPCKVSGDCVSGQCVGYLCQ